MLYILHGADTYRSRAKLQNILDRFSTQTDSKSRLFSIEAEYADPEQLKELIAAHSLFGGTLVIIGRQLLGDPAWATMALELLPALAASPNLFFFLEKELEPQLIDQLKAHAKEIQEFRPLPAPALRRWLAERARTSNIAVSRQDIDTLIQKYGADLFALEQALATLRETKDNMQSARTVVAANLFTAVDAIFEGTSRRAWVALQDFFYRGGSAEELFWKLMWQAKNIIIMKQLSDAGLDAASESGLHPFVAKKSLRFGERLECAALCAWWEELIGSLHDSRLAGNDMRAVIERAVFRLHPARAPQR